MYYIMYERMVTRGYLPDHPMLKFVGFGERITSAGNPDLDEILDHIASNKINYVQHTTSNDTVFSSTSGQMFHANMISRI
eukprot:TRINITY_DN7496_c0_g1_i1.p1 TRINITY_DN7496_c0_g1~~TRINITY_DN7496_c0_g1_i1.p1  ORF type:complete len:80 (-),score=5.83 TRINITY_DN7496_c0_g1_i1:431-670(-)